MTSGAGRRKAALMIVGLAVSLASRQMPAEEVPAWQWPVADAEPSATFGTRIGDSVLRGVQLEGGGREVYPVVAGIVVASVSLQPGRSTGPASGLGSYVVVDHNQSFRSVYAHLEPDDLPAVGAVVGSETRIGTIGSSGQIDRRALRLYVIDLERGEYVNPLLLLPDVPDQAAPQIAAVYAADGRTVYDLRLEHELPPGTYEIVAHITDRFSPAVRAARFAPYAVQFAVAGRQSFAVNKDRMAADGGTLRIEPGSVGVGSLYDAQGLYRLGTVEVGLGPTELSIVARDVAGNETSFAATLMGRTDREGE